jgi:hypothetical protein
MSDAENRWHHSFLGTSNWLSGFCRSPRRTFHPTRNGSRWAKFFSREVRTSPYQPSHGPGIAAFLAFADRPICFADGEANPALVEYVVRMVQRAEGATACPIVHRAYAALSEGELTLSEGYGSSWIP